MMNANRQHIAALRALLGGQISHPGDIKMHAQALDEIAGRGDTAATLEAVAALNATCVACHTPFRKPAAPPAG